MPRNMRFQAILFTQFSIQFQVKAAKAQARQPKNKTTSTDDTSQSTASGGAEIIGQAAATATPSGDCSNTNSS